MPQTPGSGLRPDNPRRSVLIDDAAILYLISPYHPTLALNGGGFPEGFACHHLNPIRYVVRRASHPVISATVARLRRVRQEHAGFYKIILEYTQLCDIVSHHNEKLSRSRASAAIGLSDLVTRFICFLSSF